MRRLHCFHPGGRSQMPPAFTHQTRNPVSLVIGFPCPKRVNAHLLGLLKSCKSSQRASVAGHGDHGSFSCMALSSLIWASTQVKSKMCLSSNTTATLCVQLWPNTMCAVVDVDEISRMQSELYEKVMSRPTSIHEVSRNSKELREMDMEMNQCSILSATGQSDQ